MGHPRALFHLFVFFQQLKTSAGFEVKFTFPWLSITLLALDFVSRSFNVGRLFDESSTAYDLRLKSVSVSLKASFDFVKAPSHSV